MVFGQGALGGSGTLVANVANRFSSESIFCVYILCIRGDIESRKMWNDVGVAVLVILCSDVIISLYDCVPSSLFNISHKSKQAVYFVHGRIEQGLSRGLVLGIGL
jgi:hypothetical protein